MSNNNQEQQQNESHIDLNNPIVSIPGKPAYAHSQIELLVYLLWSELYILDNTCTVQEKNGDIFVIHFNNTTIRAVCIAQYLRIYAELHTNNKDIQSIGLTFNVSTIFKRMFSHKLSLDPQHITAALRLPQQRITDIINNRIVIPILSENISFSQEENNFSNTLMRKFLSLQALMLEICLFLKKSDIYRFLTSSQYLLKLFWQSNEFFFALYAKQFGKTGFKLQQLQWREVYLKKLKK